MADKPWKRSERAVAKKLSGHRVGCTGRRTADVDAGWIVAEVKHRRQLPRWLTDALRQVTAAANDSQLPIAVLHESSTHHSNDIVCVRLADFIDWFGSLPAVLPDGTG